MKKKVADVKREIKELKTLYEDLVNIQDLLLANKKQYAKQESLIEEMSENIHIMAPTSESPRQVMTKAAQIVNDRIMHLKNCIDMAEIEV